MKIKAKPGDLTITLLAPGLDRWGCPNTAVRPITDAPVYKFAATGSLIPLIEYYEGKLGRPLTHEDQMAILAEAGWKSVLLERIRRDGFRTGVGVGWPLVQGQAVLDGQSRIAICAVLGIEEIDVECCVQERYKQWTQAHQVLDADGQLRWIDVTLPPDWRPRPGRRYSHGAAKAIRALKDLIDFDGRSVLDLGCAEGKACRFAVDQGAKSVLGVDREPGMGGHRLIAQNVVQQARDMDWILGYADSPILYEAHNLAYWTPEHEHDIVLALRVHYHFRAAGGMFLARASMAAREALIVQCNTVHKGDLGEYAGPEWCMDILEAMWDTVEIVDCDEVPLIVCRGRKPFPLISVVMPNYNMAKFLPEAVDTVIHQTVEDWELIIVDDGSTDDSQKYLDSLTDPRIRVIYREHEGLVSTLNAGLSRARGQYIARQDSDDTSVLHRFEKQLDFLVQHPELDGCGSWFQAMAEDGRVGRIVNVFPDDWRRCWESLPSFTVIPHPCYFFHRRVYDRFQYLPRYIQAEDYEFLYRAMDVFRLANVQEALVCHRAHDGQRDRDNNFSNIHNWTKIIRDRYDGKRVRPL